MPPKPKPKPAVAAKATAASRLTIVARGKAAAKGRQGTGTSRGGRGGGGKAVPDIPREGGGRLNLNRGVPSTTVPSIGVPSTSTADRRRGGGGGIPTLPLLTGAATGGSTARSDRLVTPTRQPVGPGRETSGGRKSVVEGTSETGGNHSPSSEKTVYGSVSRTSQATQFPPARLGPSASQRHNLILNDSPPSRFQGRALDMIQEEPEEEDEQEEEDYYADFAEEHIEMEEEDEVDALQHGDAADEDDAPQQVEAPQQIQDYEQQLEYLLQLPGRERLLRLSEHPIPNEATIWFDRDDGVLAKCTLTDHKGTIFGLGDLPRMQRKRKRTQSCASSSVPQLSEMQEKLAAQRKLDAQDADNARRDEEQRKRDEEQRKRDEEQRKRDEEHRKGQEQLAEMTKLLTFFKTSDPRIAAYMTNDQPTTSGEEPTIPPTPQS
ncbi:hypothetical protein AALP_AA2G139100 [Arabis alpina]|uniref:Uncharacterized protein n=1 Tax=Arabis alpina TaxID=50452 RepID=A0A087HHA9_ARAAL|nr:hypothetical protein AALP_AA2G139100 [Arabis alpina]